MTKNNAFMTSEVQQVVFTLCTLAKHPLSIISSISLITHSRQE